MPVLRPLGMRTRDSERLAGVHPDLSTIVMRLLDAMEVLGFPMFVVEAVRGDEAQAQKYAQGRTTPGPIVTQVDGVVKKSMHQIQVDGYGHAVDFAFVDDPHTAKIETWDPAQPWDVMGVMAEAYSLTWGGRWRTLVDRPHIEMPLTWRGTLL